MYIKGITDYDRTGEQRETGLFAGLVSGDGELRSAKTSGKSYGQASVRAFNRKDGTAAFMTIKSFQPGTAEIIAELRKGDRILAAGVVETREYNGKTYTDMLVDLLLTADALPAAPSSQAANRAALGERMESAGFAEIGEEDGELPF